MDDCCAVCAEPLDCVAYGLCGHREVCSTCVVRLRLVMEDKHCCICKIESPVVFVTKALGDYTRVISDFSFLPSGAEGQVGSYWYHEDTQAYFDDVDHYKMIKAMCRLSCSICDKSTSESQGNEALKNKEKFRNVNQLKRHLFHRHNSFMCDLCLEGRKVFICEQRLYSRAQLNQHMSTGDSEVDGSESERGGFSGHPICDFCRKRFYGENELYLHMSREHYTCHICQRRNPGQYDYFKDYADLETHFWQEHFVCEDEACLEKKFVVFATESEMKRHNAIQHGGHMSRSKRNAALKIPISFRYRRRNEHDSRRGRGQGYDPETSSHQLSVAIQASIETANMEQTRNGSSGVQAGPSRNEGIDVDSIAGPFEAVSASSEQGPEVVSSRYLEALSQRSKNAPLEESSFPPLPVAQRNDEQGTTDQRVPIQGSMAARIRSRSKGSVKVLNSGQSRMPMGSLSTVVDSAQRRISPNHVIGQSSTSISSREPSSKNKSSQSTSTPNPSRSNQPSTVVNCTQTRGTSPNHGIGLSSASVSTWESSSDNHSSRQAPALNLDERTSGKGSASKFSIPASISDQGTSQESNLLVLGVDIQAANRSLVQKIQSGLNVNEERYASFKEISAQYRQGQIDTKAYLMHVQQFGLSHLVLDLARLCPDSYKRRELLDAYDAGVKNNGISTGNIKDTAEPGPAIKTASAKGKAKVTGSIISSNSKASMADHVMETVRRLQATNKPWEVEVEVLAKDGYRSLKGKAKVLPVEDRTESSPMSRPSNDSSGRRKSLVANQAQEGGGWSCTTCTLLNKAAASECAACGMANGAFGSNAGDEGRSKTKKKTSKFHRARLGDGSAAALLDLRPAEISPRHHPDVMSDKGGGENLPVRGVWRDGGGKKLMAVALKQPSK